MPAVHVRHPIRCQATIAGLLATALATGCATASIAPPLVSRAPELSAEPASDSVPATRYGRYTLVEMVPEPAQRDLLQQVIDISIPPTFDTTVGGALRHVLLHTGYRLCETSEAAPLYALPLPAAQLRLGPLPLRDALLTLAGPAWALSVDDAARSVCFARVATARAPGTGTASAASASGAPAANPVQEPLP